MPTQYHLLRKLENFSCPELNEKAKSKSVDERVILFVILVNSAVYEFRTVGDEYSTVKHQEN